MGKKLLYLAVFAAGFGAGVGATWKYIKDKYDAILDEEIKSIKETLLKIKENNTEEPTEDSDEDIQTPETAEANEYDTLVESYTKNYTSGNDKMDKPYVIEPYDFGEFDDYETITLNYYADKVLADEQDNIIEEVDELVGYESLRHFGDYEDDIVHVRNDAKKCDYEICRDVRKFSEVAGV